MGKNSSVGNPQLYESGDQRTISQKDQRQQKAEQRYDEGTKNSHQATDSKDQRSIANRLSAAESSNKHTPNTTGETSRDPRAAAVSHGNKPSKGAKIDAEIQAEEDAVLAKKSGTDSLPGKK